MARYYDPELERWVSMDDQEAQGVGSALDMWNQGYFSDIGALNQSAYTSGAGGQSFPDTQSYLNYLYGGATPETINGETWYKVNNLGTGPLDGRTPITYNPPDSAGSQLVKAGILGLAGAGLTGMLPGTENVFSGMFPNSFPVSENAILNGANPSTLAQMGGTAAEAAVPASEFSLVGGTAGNLAGTGGLSSAAGINGLGAGVGEAGLGLTSGAAGAAGVAGGVGGSSLLTPAITGAATGLPAAISGAVSAPAAMGGSASATAPAASTGSALSRLFDGSATTSDYTSLLGTLGATGLGLAGANAQGNALKDVYSQQMALGAPYRDMLAQSYSPNFSMANQPDFMNALNLGADAVARATSTKANTFDPGAQAEMQKYVSGSLALPQLNAYRSQLGSFGQLGTNTAGAAALGQAQSQGGTYNALGYGLGQMTQPDNPFKGLLSQFGKQNSLFSF